MKVIRTLEEFEKLKNLELIVVIVKSNTCGVCEVITAKLDELLNNFSNIPFYAIYADQMKEFSGQHLVFTVPTVLIFSQGKEILRESRFVNINNIKRLLENYLA